jgi:hypothetical protein
MRDKHLGAKHSTAAIQLYQQRRAQQRPTSHAVAEENTIPGRSRLLLQIGVEIAILGRLAASQNKKAE